MAKNLNLVVFAALAAVALLQSSVAATTHTVGGNLGWHVLPNASATYQAWAANETFVVGDILVFNYTNGYHNVAQLTKTNYDSCTPTSPISLSSIPPVRITLTNSGENFFVCTVGNHCSSGQKLAINVTGDSTGATPPSSAATSLGVAGLSATFFSIALALWF